MSDSSRFTSTIAKAYPGLFKLGILCIPAAALLHLAGAGSIAGVVGWLAVLFCGAGVVLAGIASSSTRGEPAAMRPNAAGTADREGTG